MNSGTFRNRVRKATVFLGVFLKISKNEDTWCRVLESFDTPDDIQLGEYSKSSGLGDTLHVNGAMRAVT